MKTATGESPPMDDATQAWPDPLGDLRRWREAAKIPQPIDPREVEHQAIAYLIDHDRDPQPG